jgi:hypothetical protein
MCRLLTSLLFLALTADLATALAVDWDTYSDTWVATDGLGRTLPTCTEVGPPRGSRQVGIFYFLWLGGAAGDPDRSRVHDISRILADNPTNPQWGPRWAFHHWGRPLFDYYRSDDRYVLRKHAQMLADAGVDAIYFDYSNYMTYEGPWRALSEEFDTIRSTGHRVPQFAFLTRADSNMVAKLYDTVYAPGLFPALWFNWGGRPLIFAPSHNVPLNLQAYFTVRESWAWHDPTGWFGNGYNKWPWLDNYPQAYGWHFSPDVREEISVCVAQHPTSNIGRSFRANRAPPPNEQQPDLGLCFDEQWSTALATNAAMTFVTGWNEWIAQRFVAGVDDLDTNGRPDYPSFLGQPTTYGQTFFVDQYSQEYSRDIEPMTAGHGDNYYYQLIANIRRLKGVRPIERVTSGSISIDGAFGDWSAVRPEFRDNIGGPARRDHPGYEWPGANFVNRSGRNDLIVAKISRDADNVHFYIRARDPITPPGEHWMLLFIDADRNAQTGWLGYDLVVNRTGVTATSTKVERNVGGRYQWGEAQIIPMHFAGNELELSLPSALLGGSPSFDFKWADNIEETGEWSDFTLNGDAAPNDRFNYRAQFWSKVIYVDAAHTGCQDGTLPCPFQTVQAAYNASADGTILSIAAGRYAEALHISKCVRLESRAGTARIGR